MKAFVRELGGIVSSRFDLRFTWKNIFKMNNTVLSKCRILFCQCSIIRSTDQYWLHIEIDFVIHPYLFLQTMKKWEMVKSKNQLILEDSRQKHIFFKWLRIAHFRLEIKSSHECVLLFIGLTCAAITVRCFLFY